MVMQMIKHRSDISLIIVSLMIQYVVVINYHLHRESSMNLMIIVILGFAGC
jgi:hypothetical protein